MATLEVHDDEGRIERVAISREQPALFGSSPKCDIVLNGPGVLPLHGRIRWKSNRYKVDAFPEAQYVLVNGLKMASTSFHQGDEIQVGPCQIFLLHDDEDLPRETPRKNDITRVPPAPVVARRPPPLEQVDWRNDLEVIPPSIETEIVEPTPARTPSPTPTRTRRPAGRKGRVPRSPKAARNAGKIWKALMPGNQPPGQERILSSPLVVGLVVTLVILVVLGVSLRRIIAETVATRLYHRAIESVDDGDYPTAIRLFGELLASNPHDERASKARVLRALANVRQFASPPGTSWSNALEAEREMVRTMSGEPAYRDTSIDLAELVLKTGEGLAERARATADAKVLAEAESAVSLFAHVAGNASGPMLARSKLSSKLDEARAAVRKHASRARALAAMDAALRAGSSAAVYTARDALIHQYADLADDRELIDRMTRANDLVRRAVTFDATRRPAETAPHAEPLGPPVSLVLRGPSSATPSAPGPIVHALAEGFAYGLDGASGAPLWHIPVGLSSPFPPKAVAGGTTALVFDARYDELVQVDAKTGKPIWRQGLSEPVTDPPLVLGNQVIQATPGGKLLLFDLVSGELQGTFNLGSPLARAPVSDEAGQFLYVVADQDCLFLLKRDPPSCADVEYLGHAAGSLPCPPARLGRFLIVPENHTPSESRWRILLVDEDGVSIKPVQQVKVAGWTWDTPASSGSVIWSTDDRGGVAAYAVGSYEAKDPFRLVARINPEAAPLGPAFALARSEHELWLASGRSARHELDAERGTIATPWPLGEAGPALAPLQMAGPWMVLTHQDTEMPGVVLWGVDPASGAVRWRTVLGSPWPVALAEDPDRQELTTFGLDGRKLTLSPSRLASGGFIESSVPGPGRFRLPPGPLHRLDAEGLSVIIPGPDARHLLTGGGAGDFRRIDLPAPLGAAPMLWGHDVLVPGGDGRAYLVDPESGAARAEPFIPPFDRAHPTRWRSPVALDGDAVALADNLGRVRRLTRLTEPRARLVASTAVDLGAALVADPASTGSAILVVTADGRVRALAARDLSPVGAWPLDAPLAMPLASIEGRGFLADITGGIFAFGPDGRRLWSATLLDAPTSHPPAIRDHSAWFLARDGSLQRQSLADGDALDRIDLDILPAGGLRTAGPVLVVPVAPGTVRALRFEDRSSVHK